MEHLFFKGKIIGDFTPDEMDPPFGSGYFKAIPSEDPLVIDAQQYLVFTFKEFEISDTSKAYAEFEKALECDYADWYFSPEWKIGRDASDAYEIVQPMLSREGLLVFQVPE